jgi:Transposase zinc-binding domain
MNRPPLEVADIIRSAAESFLEQSRRCITWQHRKVLLAILRCRTALLGGHRDRCSDCGHVAISYNSCGNRHCPKCQGNARLRWLAARERELCPQDTCTQSSLYRVNWRRWLCRTRRLSSTCCFMPARRRSSR